MKRENHGFISFLMQMKNNWCNYYRQHRINSSQVGTSHQLMDTLVSAVCEQFTEQTSYSTELPEESIIVPSTVVVNESYPLTTTVETNKPLQISMREPHWKHDLGLQEQSTYIFVLPAGMFFKSSGLTVA